MKDIPILKELDSSLISLLSFKFWNKKDQKTAHTSRKDALLSIYPSAKKFKKSEIGCQCTRECQNKNCIFFGWFNFYTSRSILEFIDFKAAKCVPGCSLQTSIHQQLLWYCEELDPLPRLVFQSDGESK